MIPEATRTVFFTHALILGALSFLTFVAYGVDKRRAKTSRRRIPERTLHRLAWLGGAPGGWLGRKMFRHKTRKRRFSVQLTMATVVHAAIAGTLAWLWLR